MVWTRWRRGSERSNCGGIGVSERAFYGWVKLDWLGVAEVRQLKTV